MKKLFLSLYILSCALIVIASAAVKADAIHEFDMRDQPTRVLSWIEVTENDDGTPVTGTPIRYQVYRDGQPLGDPITELSLTFTLIEGESIYTVVPINTDDMEGPLSDPKIVVARLPKPPAQVTGMEVQ